MLVKSILAPCIMLPMQDIKIFQSPNLCQLFGAVLCNQAIKAKVVNILVINFIIKISN